MPIIDPRLNASIPAPPNLKVIIKRAQDGNVAISKTEG